MQFVLSAPEAAQEECPQLPAEIVLSLVDSTLKLESMCANIQHPSRVSTTERRQEE